MPSSKPTTPFKMFFLIGLMGSGKTFWANRIAEHNHFNCIDTDVYIETTSKMSVSNIFKEFGELHFRKLEQNFIQEIQPKNNHSIISTGGGTACFFDNMQTMNQKGITIWLDEDVDIIYNRILLQNSRPLLEKIKTSNLKSYLNEMLLTRKIFYQQAKYILHSQEANFNSLQKIIIQNV